MDTSSVNGWRENTHTASGVLLKPIYGIAVLGEAIWTIPGFVIGVGVAYSPKIVGGDFNVVGLSGTLLAGYLPIEAVVKVIEVSIKTVLWPIDRLVALSARRQLSRTRLTVLDQHKTGHPHNPSGGDVK